MAKMAQLSKWTIKQTSSLYSPFPRIWSWPDVKLLETPSRCLIKWQTRCQRWLTLGILRLKPKKPGLCLRWWFNDLWPWKKGDNASLVIPSFPKCNFRPERISLFLAFFPLLYPVFHKLYKTRPKKTNSFAPRPHCMCLWGGCAWVMLFTSIR